MKKFSASVWAKDGASGIRPIGSVQEAQIFLDGWPIAERGPLYYVAANSMKSAEEGSLTPDEAKEVLIMFLAEVDALSEERLGSEC